MQNPERPPRATVDLKGVAQVGGWMLLLVALAWAAGCSGGDIRRRPPRRVADADARIYSMEVTGYCHCGDCCGWHRNWLGRPVFSSGPQKGQRKPVGITASGAPVRPGTIAADTRLFPFGTIMYVPGYGYGMVEDRGGAIRGQKLDLYFRTHRQAREWGRQHVQVKVWLP
jgi:3D (Asp-Asp-Asp) domain-containing protein